MKDVERRKLSGIAAGRMKLASCTSITALGAKPEPWRKRECRYVQNGEKPRQHGNGNPVRNRAQAAMAATLVACVAMNAHGVLPAVAQRLAKLEATFLGIVRLLKARRPDLAPELDEMEKGCLATKEAGATGRRGARSKRERQIRGRWENRDGAWVLMRETRTLAVVHRDSGGWRATFLPGLRAFSDAAAARKAVAQYLKVRPAPPETE